MRLLLFILLELASAGRCDTATFTPTASPTPTPTATQTQTPGCSIRLDTVSSDASSDTDFAWAHTVNASDYGIIVVGLAYYGLNSSIAVTYAGNPLTVIQDNICDSNADLFPPAGADGSIVEIWYLLNPPIGTANIEVTQVGNSVAVAGAASYNGVASIGNNTYGCGATGSDTYLADGMTTSSPFTKLVQVSSLNRIGTISLDSSLTSRWDLTNGTGIPGITGDQSDKDFGIVAHYVWDYQTDIPGVLNSVSAELVGACYYSPTPTPAYTLTSTETQTQSYTNSPTPTWTPTRTPTFTFSPTISRTLTFSPTSTTSPTPSWTPTITQTNTPRSTPTPGGDLLYFCGSSISGLTGAPAHIWTFAPGGGNADYIQSIQITASNSTGVQPVFSLASLNSLDTGSGIVWTPRPRDSDQGAGTAIITTWPAAPTITDQSPQTIQSDQATCADASQTTCKINWNFLGQGTLQNLWQLVVHNGQELAIAVNGPCSTVTINITYVERAEGTGPASAATTDFGGNTTVFTTATSGPAVNIVGGVKSFTLQVSAQGSVTSWTAALQGSLDGVNWTDILTRKSTNPNPYQTASGAVDAPETYIRSNVSALTLGPGTSITVIIFGTR